MDHRWPTASCGWTTRRATSSWRGSWWRRATHPELPLVLLRVQPDNTRAIRAYAAAGFVDVPADEQPTWNEGQRAVYHWMVMPA